MKFAVRIALLTLLVLSCLLLPPPVPAETARAAEPEAVRLLRYWNLDAGDHLYSTDTAELGADGKDGYVSEGDAGWVLNAPASGAVPLHRYWNAVGKDHFYTTNIDEIGPNGRYGWTYERIEGYCFPHELPGTTSLHRYWNGGLFDHFYTTKTVGSLW